MKPVSLIKALILLSFVSSNFERLSGLRYPLSVIEYFNSPSFNSKRGVGKKFINNNDNSYLSALISWKQISESIFPADPIFEKADSVYSDVRN